MIKKTSIIGVLMTALNLSVDELLSTTRAVRKRLDFERTVGIDVIKECLEMALQAPNGSNSQNWHFLIVTELSKKQKIAEFYRQVWEEYSKSPRAADRLHQDDPVLAPVQKRIFSSAEYLAQNLEKTPILFIPCIAGRVEKVSGPIAGFHASIIPAVWSFMLAARSRGLGTCWTTFHLKYEKEVAAILEIPFEKITQVALIPVAYTIGTKFKTAARKPLKEVLHLESW